MFYTLRRPGLPRTLVYHHKIAYLQIKIFQQKIPTISHIVPSRNLVVNPYSLLHVLGINFHPQIKLLPPMMYE